MEICTFASGSSGNCSLISSCGTHILLDAGISWKRITACLREKCLSPEDLSAVLVTHEHTDHISSLKTMLHHVDLPIFASRGTALALGRVLEAPESSLCPFEAGEEFTLGNIHIRSFPTPHDTPDSVGYTMEDNLGKLGFMTDLGHLTDPVREAVLGCDTVVLESNHDENMLQSGPYPYYLKRRILGDRGHLSNRTAAGFAGELLIHGTKRIILAHLSRENNTPALAWDACAAALRQLDAEVGMDIDLSVAGPDEMSKVYLV